MRLMSIDTNAKLAKTNKATGGYLVAGLSLYPDNELCPGAKAAGCMATCLKEAGRAAFTPSINPARMRKADRYKTDRAGFMLDLVWDLEALIRKAGREDKTPAARLNVLSDIAWESEPITRNGVTYPGVPQAFPEITFYDYTKRATRIGKTPENYHLTFSYSGVKSYANQVKLAETRGANMAVVFYKKLPAEFNGRPVIDGDKTDARFADPAGVVVGLLAKGPAKNDMSGFVVRAA
jgi:hypothetical protein